MLGVLVTRGDGDVTMCGGGGVAVVTMPACVGVDVVEVVVVAVVGAMSGYCFMSASIISAGMRHGGWYGSPEGPGRSDSGRGGSFAAYRLSSSVMFSRMCRIIDSCSSFCCCSSYHCWNAANSANSSEQSF